MKTIVLGYGRMNPPHKGHDALINKMRELSIEHSCHHELVLVDSIDEKNPLPPQLKFQYIRKFYPDIHINITTKSNMFHLLTQYYNLGCRHIILVCGADRSDKYKYYLNKYNGEEAAHGRYNFKKIDIIEVPREDGVSGRYVRQYVKYDDYENFRKCIPERIGDEDTKKLFEDIRKGI